MNLRKCIWTEKRSNGKEWVEKQRKGYFHGFFQIVDGEYCAHPVAVVEDEKGNVININYEHDKLMLCEAVDK